MIITIQVTTVFFLATYRHDNIIKQYKFFFIFLSFSESVSLSTHSIFLGSPLKYPIPFLSSMLELNFFNS
jgi:hypothetical protein